jgi:flagellar motor switch protein FliN/FliY
VPETLRRFAAAFFEAAGPALTTLTNRSVSVSVVELAATTAADLVARLPLPWVVLEGRYGRGLEGSHHLLLPVASALVLAHALNPDPPGEDLDLSADHLDAVRETGNHLFGAAASSLGPLIARSVAFEPVGLAVVEDADALPADLSPASGRAWAVRAEARGPEEFRLEMWLTVGRDLAQEILAVGHQAEPAPAPAGAGASAAAPSGIDLILDVTLPLAVELGRARMQIQDILRLAPGSIVELDKSAGDPVDILINDRPIARGEVVVIDENFGVRLTSIVTTAERIRSMR